VCGTARKARQATSKAGDGKEVAEQGTADKAGQAKSMAKKAMKGRVGEMSRRAE
jgi:hypothetical protein